MSKPQMSEAFYMCRRTFALMHGHTEECVEETVNGMSAMINEVCKQSETNVNDVLSCMDPTIIEQHLIKILEQKDCDCIKKMQESSKTK